MRFQGKYCIRSRSQPPTYFIQPLFYPVSPPQRRSRICRRQISIGGRFLNSLLLVPLLPLTSTINNVPLASQCFRPCCHYYRRLTLSTFINYTNSLIKQSNFHCLRFGSPKNKYVECAFISYFCWTSWFENQFPLVRALLKNIEFSQSYSAANFMPEIMIWIN